MKVTGVYLIIFICSVIFASVLTPVMRKIALTLNILDRPNSKIKTHKEPVPYLGGLAVWLSYIFTMILLRLATNFPTGTLHALRGIVIGSFLIIFVGLVDDFHVRGIGYIIKFIAQFGAAVILVLYDIRIKFIRPDFIAILLSVLWIVGITNAFNILDVMDGLSSSVAIVASIGFFIISMPTERIYVNFGSIVMLGACLGFIPYNLSKKLRIFLGDTGSMFIGYVLSALAMGTSYTTVNRVGLYTPLVILAIPIYETLLVMFFRMKKGQSPFRGSKDHYSLRMEMMGFSRSVILLCTVLVSIALTGIAYVITRVRTSHALILYGSVVILFLFTMRWLGRVEIE
jgi:UDP-GlcNAc:undecaprenyl-phosphate GlcNAc-1-phosphate transferase